MEFLVEVVWLGGLEGWEVGLWSWVKAEVTHGVDSVCVEDWLADLVFGGVEGALGEVGVVAEDFELFGYGLGGLEADFKLWRFENRQENFI